MAGWLDFAGTIGSGIIGAVGNAVGQSKSSAKSSKALKDYLKRQEASKVAAMGYLQPDAEAGGNADLMVASRMTADPSRRNPSQEIAREDLIRTGRSNLSAGGLRGAGRAGQAVLDDSVRRFDAGVYDANQGRSDAAANLLSQRGAAARSGLANIESGTGSSMAGNVLDAGSSDASQTGDYWASQANLLGQTLGAVAGLARRKVTPRYTPGMTTP